MTYDKNKIEENIVNIAMRAGELLMAGKIERDDISGHQGLTNSIINLAYEFEKQHAGVDFDESELDYWEEIDRFSEEKLLEQYGREQPEVSEPLQIKVFVEDGIVQEVLKDSNVPVQVEVVDIDTDYEDRDALIAYRDSLYRDPKLMKCDYGVADFADDEPPAVSNAQSEREEDPVKVFAVSAGGVRREFFAGDFDECTLFCENHNWTFKDENDFEWDLEIEDSREASFPEGYHTAANHYCDMAGADIENEFVRQHADKLVCCFQNNLYFEDFVAWVTCEKALGETLSLSEYSYLEEKYDITSIDDPVYSVFVDGIRNGLAKFRDQTAQKTSKVSLNDKIQSASDRTSQNVSCKESKQINKEQDR